MTRSLEETLHGHTTDQWALDFLRAAGFEATPANVQVVVSWEYAESGAGGGFYNPLNTTQGGFPGSTDFNSVGVKNYRTYADGVAANAKVIHNGYYGAVVDAFRAGDDPNRTIAAITRSPWGTRHIALRGPATFPSPASEVEMALIASPHKPTSPGRTAAACWSPTAPNMVALTNGASIAHDVPNQHGIRVWRPPLPPGQTGIGIMATIGPDGRPDGKGIVFQDSGGDTYVGLWS